MTNNDEAIMIRLNKLDMKVHILSEKVEEVILKHNLLLEKLELMGLD